MKTMSRICFALLLLCLSASTNPQPAPAQASPAGAQAAGEKVWPSQPPAGIPFAASTELTGIAFTGKHAQYAHADTWYPSWASDGNLYSPWTDGEVNGVRADSFGAKATTGNATIRGDSPMNLVIADVGTFAASPVPYEGRYPAGSLVYRGVWYYGTYCLHQTPEMVQKRLNWDVLGPFVGFRYSTDYGHTWHETTHTPTHPLFPEPSHFGGKVKMGVPHFVDFGRDMKYSPDGLAYLVAHGSSDPDPQPRVADLSWITADEIYLARVKPSPHNMDTASKYEFFAGLDHSNKAKWTHDFSRIVPLLKWPNNMGSVTMTYDAPLKKYLLVVTDGGTTVSKYSTYILESSLITGPWKLVVYMKDFGEQAYFVNFPSKFISGDGKMAWLTYSANFTNGWIGTKYKAIPEGSGYSWTLQEVHLLGPREPK